jgi:hypothetical protein
LAEKKVENKKDNIEIKTIMSDNKINIKKEDVHSRSEEKELQDYADK